MKTKQNRVAISEATAKIDQETAECYITDENNRVKLASGITQNVARNFHIRKHCDVNQVTGIPFVKSLYDVNSRRICHPHLFL